MDRLVLPALQAYKPDILIVACGFDAALIDPLSRMLATADTFRVMTQKVKDLAQDICGGRLVLVHEGGYSEVYVPFCGHATIEVLTGSKITAPDPFAETFALRQPNARFEAFLSNEISEMAKAVKL